MDRSRLTAEKGQDYQEDRLRIESASVRRAEATDVGMPTLPTWSNELGQQEAADNDGREHQRTDGAREMRRPRRTRETRGRRTLRAGTPTAATRLRTT